MLATRDESVARALARESSSCATADSNRGSVDAVSRVAEPIV